MTPIQRAFLAALAVGESGGQYDILYGGGHFADYSKFPAWAGKEGPAGISHAAGAYQFEPMTWAGQQTKLGLPDFSPASQDAAAWDLAATVYLHKTTRDLAKDLDAGKLDDVASALHSTWTSLSSSTFPARFKAALAKETPVADTPAPAPASNLGLSHVAAASVAGLSAVQMLTTALQYHLHLPADVAGSDAGLILLALGSLSGIGITILKRFGVSAS